MGTSSLSVDKTDIDKVSKHSIVAKRKNIDEPSRIKTVDQEVEDFLKTLHDLATKIGVELSIFKGTGKLKGLNRKPIGELKSLLNAFDQNSTGDVKELRLRVDEFVSKKMKKCL
jgi:hypothetical protein